MPIYEYQCTQCEERFEVRQSMGEDGSKLHCPKCTAPNPKRVISSFSSPGSSTSESSKISPPTTVRRSRCGPQYRLDKLKKKRK